MERHRTSDSHNTPVYRELGAKESLRISKTLIDHRLQSPMRSIMLTCFTPKKLGSGSCYGNPGAELHFIGSSKFKRFAHKYIIKVVGIRTFGIGSELQELELYRQHNSTSEAVTFSAPGPWKFTDVPKNFLHRTTARPRVHPRIWNQYNTTPLIPD